MIRFFTHKPLTQDEAILKLSQKTNVSSLTSQILAMAELEENGKGQLLNIVA